MFRMGDTVPLMDLGSKTLDVAERVVHGDAETAKVSDVPGRDAPALRFGGRENQEVSLLDGSPTTACFRFQSGASDGDFAIERHHFAVGQQKLGKPVLQEVALSPHREPPDARSELVDPDGRKHED